jgi:hypothetical protein
MSEPKTEAERQHMMMLVESAQRAGYSERKIAEIVDDAVEADAQIEEAA